MQPCPLPGSIHCIVENKMFEVSFFQKQPLYFIFLGFISLWLRMQAYIFLVAGLRQLHGHRKGWMASELPCSA